MSGIQSNLLSSMISDSQSITFQTYDVVFYTDGIGIESRFQDKSHTIDVSELKDLESWDKALSHPFFLNHYLHFVSIEDSDKLPEDLKAIFRLQSIFFDYNGMPQYEVVRRGSFKATDYAISAFRALLKLQTSTSQRATAMMYYIKGMAYEYGLGCPVSQLKSKQAYQKSADMGDVRAQLLCGYRKKEDEQYAEAEVFFEKAAQQGSAEALNELGDLYYYGYGVNQDCEKAIDLMRQSAQKGYQLAIDNLCSLNRSIDQQETPNSLDEDSFVDIEGLTDRELLSRLMDPKTLPLKKRRIAFYNFKKQFIERFRSADSGELPVQSPKRQKMYAETA